MSSEKTMNCRVALRGMTTLKNRRPMPDKPGHYIYDALFSCADSALGEEDGIGSFRLYVPKDGQVRNDGTYDIFAKIASYQANRNTLSNDFEESSINVLGDIDTLHPLLDDDDKQQLLDNNELTYDDTMKITVCGTVTSTDKTTCTFFMHGLQYVCGQQQEVFIRAHMNNPKWKDPSVVLPHAKAVVGFDSRLDGFEPFFAPNKSDPITRIVVAVQDISFLRAPSDDTNTSKPSLSPAKQTSIRDKIKRRRQKQVKKEPKSVTPETSPAPTLPSSS